MSGTPQGGKAAAATNRKKYDAYYLEKYGMTFYQYQGHRGGKARVVKGFGANRDLARAAGQRGGRISRRPKRVED